jgi:hypothetical protein
MLNFGSMGGGDMSSISSSWSPWPVLQGMSSFGGGGNNIQQGEWDWMKGGGLGGGTSGGMSGMGSAGLSPQMLGGLGGQQTKAEPPHFAPPAGIPGQARGPGAPVSIPVPGHPVPPQRPSLAEILSGRR